MRHLMVLAAAAPLALIAACGEATPVDEVEPEPMPTEDIAVTADLPEIPENSLATVDYPGVYSQDGRTRLRLNENMTYELTRPDGTTATGTFSEMEDGRRIRLEDFEGGPAWFAVGSDAIYRLPDENTPSSEITAEGEYKREPDTPAPAATTPVPEVPEPAE